MRVAFLNHTADWSGAEVSLLHLIAALTDIEPLLFCPPEGELPRRAAAQGLTVVPVPAFTPAYSRSPTALGAGAGQAVAAAVAVGRLLESHQVAVVHANSVRAGLIASLSRRVHRRPVLWHVKDFLPRSPVGWAIRAVAAASANRSIAISNAVRRDFARLRTLATTTDTVYVSTPIVPPRDNHSKWRAELGLPTHAPVIGLVGQIAPWKRQHLGLRAFASILRSLPDARLIISGEAKFGRRQNLEYESFLRHQVRTMGLEERVIFRAPLSGVYESIDVLLHTAGREPFGLVLVEAMVREIPVVAVPSGGIPEIVTHGTTGLLAASDKVEDLAACLMRILGDEDLRRRLASAGRRRVLTTFDVASEANGIARAYRAMLRSGSER